MQSVQLLKVLLSSTLLLVLKLFMQYVNFNAFSNGAQSSGCVQSFQIECGRTMAKSLVWLRANNHFHDQPFLAMGWSNSISPRNPVLELLHSCSKSVASCITTASSMVSCTCTLMNAFGSCGMTKTQRMGYSMCQRVSWSARRNRQSSPCYCLWDTWRSSMH